MWANVGTYTYKCDICGTENVVQNYGDWACRQCLQGYTYDECHRISLTDAQLALLRNPPRWIPVGERLPPLMTEVLGWHPADRVRAWFRHSGQPKDAPYWELWSPQDRECDDCDVDEPTHWMPLPEPPQ